MRINKVTTHRGDDGDTDILGKTRLPKDSPLIVSLGALDELQSVVGVLDAHLAGLKRGDRNIAKVRKLLNSIQNDLYDIGLGVMSSVNKTNKKQYTFSESRVTTLEKSIQDYASILPPLSSFVLPGGDMAPTLSHWVRTVSRRAERVLWTCHRKHSQQKEILIYMNRLSDFFFVLGRVLARSKNHKETLWKTPLKKADHSLLRKYLF